MLNAKFYLWTFLLFYIAFLSFVFLLAEITQNTSTKFVALSFDGCALRKCFYFETNSRMHDCIIPSPLMVV